MSPRKRNVLAAVLAVSVACAAVGATGVAATTEPTVSVIDSCTTISQPGVYVLGDDVGSDGVATCLTIRASGVYVAGHDHTIGGDVAVVDAADVLLTNLDVRQGGFSFERVADGRLERVNVTGNRGAGVAVHDSTVTVVDSVIVANHGPGIQVRARSTPDGTPGAAVTVVNSGVRDNHADGISLLGLVTATVRDSLVIGNKDGVSIGDGTVDVLVTDNEIVDNDDDGVKLVGSTNATVSDNQIVWNDDDGVYVAEMRDARVTGNEIGDNHDDGIDIQSSTSGLFARNRIHRNGDDGVFLRAADSNRVLNNRIRANGDDGIDFRGSNLNRVTGNVLCENAESQFAVRGNATRNSVLMNANHC